MTIENIKEQLEINKKYLEERYRDIKIQKSALKTLLNEDYYADDIIIEVCMDLILANKMANHYLDEERKLRLEWNKLVGEGDYGI